MSPASPARLRGPSTSTILCVALLLGALPSLLSLAPLPAMEADPPEVEVLGPRRGLAALEAERRPMLLLVVPEAQRGAVDLWWSELGKGTLRRIAKGFLVVRIDLDGEGAWGAEAPPVEGETPAPWEKVRARTWLTGRIGEVTDRPLLLLLDCAGAPVARSDDELPKDAALKKGLSRTAALSQQRLRSIVEVERGLEVVGIAAKKRRFREACQTFQKLRELDLPSDHPVAEARESRFLDLKKEYDAAFAVARDLEQKDQLTRSLDEYEKVLRDFPLREWDREVRTRIGIVLGRLNGPIGGGLQGGGR